MLKIQKLHPLFGGRVQTKVNLHEGLSAEMVEDIEQAMAQYAVLVLPEQNINDMEQIRFSRSFGPLELPPHMGMKVAAEQRIDPKLYDVTNLGLDGEILPPEALKHASNKANQDFHSDSSFNGLPTKWSLLSARVIPPEGADTHYIDTRAVYDALPDTMKAKVIDAVAEHSFWKTRTKSGYKPDQKMLDSMPPTRQKIETICPRTGRKGLLIGEHITHIVGWDAQESNAFIEELYDFAAQPDFIYTHKWQQGDLIIWNNPCTLHRATSFEVFKYKRDMRRATINKFGPEISSTDFLKISAPK
ncbi:MAG: TauD/TfdA family dioxygenase [Emcibacter sp.]|nr:TauD/TfdA family dioxygenase [Emcibacter sp.]